MPKIVLFMDSPLMPTGYANTCRLTARALKKLGWDVYAVAFSDAKQPIGIVDWFDIKVIPNYALQRNGGAMYGDAEMVSRIFAEVTPDILLFHNDIYRYSYIQNLPKEILDRSVFWLPFDGEPMDDPATFKKQIEGGMHVIKDCAAIRFVTKYAFDLHKDLSVLKGRNIGIIPHTVDFESFFPPPEKEPYKAGRMKGKFVVARIDRHQPRKRWEETITAFAKFAQGKDDVFLAAKCNPRDMAMWNNTTKQGVDLEVLANQVGLECHSEGGDVVGEKIHFSDFVFNEPSLAKAYYFPADVFLTTTGGEGFGLTSIEALACGVPVICPDVPVFSEVAKEGALLCKTKGKVWNNELSVSYKVVDIDEVVQKLEWAYAEWKKGIANPEWKGSSLDELGEQGRIWVDANYRPENVYGEWDKVFKNVMAKREMASLITVLWNVSEEQITGEDGVAKLAESLKYVSSPYEWIIVDNGSPLREKTRAWMSEVASLDQHIKPLFLDANMGFAGGCNAGIAAAAGQNIILVNPDSEALPPAKHGHPGDFVKMLSDRVKEDPRIGIVATALNRRDDIFPGAVFPYFSCALVTRKCLDACKLSEGKWLDDAFFPAYFEDADFSFRAMAKGFKVEELNLPFWHKSGGTNKYLVGHGSDFAAPDSVGITALRNDLEKASCFLKADWYRKRSEIARGGMQSLIDGNIALLRTRYGTSVNQKVKIVWHSVVGAAVGFSQITEGIIPVLDKLGFDVYVDDWNNGNLMGLIEDPTIRRLWEKYKQAHSAGDLDDAIHIVCWLMEAFSNVDASNYRVGISLCESSKVRPFYVQQCNEMDRILTFTDFSRKVQLESGYKVPIDVIPPGIHPIYKSYYKRPYGHHKFRFLCVGVDQPRKNTRKLVEVFCKAFSKSDNVELFLKSNNFGNLDWVSKEGWDTKANITAIFTGQNAKQPDLTMQEMRDLYCDADCLIHPSHGEGIGMNILEGAATGLPVIFTNWSGPAELLDDSNAYPLSLATPSPAYLEAGLPGENGTWANFQEEYLIYLMKYIVGHPEEARAKGKKAAALVASKYTWEESARTLSPMLLAWDEDRKKKAHTSSFDPLTFNPPKLPVITGGDRACIDITTRDRVSYLAALLLSLRTQIFRNWDVVINDDSESPVSKDHFIYSICSLLKTEGHEITILEGTRQGPHIGHQRNVAWATGKYKLLCRIDDDIVIEDDFLEKLFVLFYLKDTECMLAAAGGIFLNPTKSRDDQYVPSDWQSNVKFSGKIEPNCIEPYVSLYPAGLPPRRVEHLHSSFMYRVEAANAIGGYCRGLSQIGFREESDFSCRFHFAGWQMLLHPEAIGWHFCAPAGGTRSAAIFSGGNWEPLVKGDNEIYERRLRRWKERFAAKAMISKSVSVTGKKGTSKNKIAAAISIPQGFTTERIQEAISYFRDKVLDPDDEIYLSCDGENFGEACLHPGIPWTGVKMVACGPEEQALLTRALLTEGDHVFIMTVSAGMRFSMPPRAMLDSHYDDYVFETYTSYLDTKAKGIIVGPENSNLCLITRRRQDAKPVQERIMYSDIMVIDDVKAAPMSKRVHRGAPMRSVFSAYGNELIAVADMEWLRWRKICVYQYPDGKLKEPFYADMEPAKKMASVIVCATEIVSLQKCIASLYDKTITPFEVIVVDCGAEEGTERWVEAEAKIRKNFKKNDFSKSKFYGSTTIAHAINLGVVRATGKYLVFMNDKTYIDQWEPDGSDWLKACITTLNENPKIGMVGSYIDKGPILGKSMVSSQLAVLSRETWNKVGQFDEINFQDYGADEDYCARLRNIGLGVSQAATSCCYLPPKKISLDANKFADTVAKLRAKHGLGEE